MKKALFTTFRILFTIAALFMVYRESGFFTSLVCTLLAAANELMQFSQKKQVELNKDIAEYIKTNSAATLNTLKKVDDITKKIDNLI